MSNTLVEKYPVLLGKYELLAELGRGGFAKVYQARDTSLDRIVALKILHPYWNEDPGFIDRFSKEARIAANLRQENIVTIYETGKIDGQLYIAMEYLDGRTLAAVLSSEGALSLDQTLPIMTQMAKAIDYAHGRGLIHRDIKPSNIILEATDRSERAVLMDFGLVKAMEESVVLTTPGTLLGSPEYMSPEQADPNKADEVGPASDLYAFGVVAYHILTGRVPFPGSSISTLHAHESRSVPPPRAINPELPESAANTLVQMLAKDPGSRFPSAGAFVTQLKNDFIIVQENRRREALLAELYRRIQIASNEESWGKVLALGEEIQAIAPNYLEVPDLMLKAHRQLNVSTRSNKPEKPQEFVQETTVHQLFASASVALFLTLIMFLLVSLSANLFIMQGQQSLKNDLQNANDQIRSVEKQQAAIELRNSAAQATLDSLEVSGTVSAAENVGLTEQLANRDMLNLTREAERVQSISDPENANATLQSFESQAPLVTIVNPQVDNKLIAGQPVELVIVASDHMGVHSIDFNIGNDGLLLGGLVEDAGLTATKRHIWTPADEGPVEIRITATNINGISSEHIFSLTVLGAATISPEPTIEATSTN